MNNLLTFEKATLITEKESKDGVLVTIKSDSSSTQMLPEKTFVPYGKSVFLTYHSDYLNKILDKCKETMLELMNVADLSIPFLDDYFFDEKSGLIINFEQPDQPENDSWTTSPVFIQLIDPIEWLNDWKGDKKKWINAMLSKNPPENLKNKLLLYNL